GSSSTSRSAEAVRQPSRSRIRRQTNRLSGVFLRGPASTSVIPTDALRADDPSELSNQITAPGILKIFGNEICEGAHYKSVLATTHSSAKELVKEALERYGLGQEEAESYVLCDTIGSTGDHRWRTEGFRVVSDNERPLILQSLWKPREGLARRFEIQRRSSIEEKTSRDKDTVTAGINAQARKLQKSRSRVTSTLIERTTGRGHKLWRSKSEMDLLDSDTEAKQDEGLCPPSSDDNTTQYSIHPPHDCPYLLLLQGCSPAQDFVIYLLDGPDLAFGRQSDHEDDTKPDTLLFATDILLRHCHFHRHGVGGPTVLCPCPNAAVMRNGEALTKEVQLDPGDVIGMGQRYLFLTYRIIKSCFIILPGMTVVPWTMGHTTTTSHTRKTDQERVVKEIVALGRTSVKDGPPLTFAFLLCLCVQYSSTCLHTSDLRRLLLLIASAVQSAMWEHTKDLAAVQPEVLSREGSNPEDLQALGQPEAISGLRPLAVWMSNSLELLQFIQYQLPLILEWRTRKEQEQEDDEGGTDDDETVLEEVIMLAFQQCVYYITKFLYPILPALLDCNPFRESARVPGSGGLQVPGEIQHLADVLTETWRLLRDCQLHPEISSQLVGYLFYFINASLFNSLMERGSEPGFYQWARGIRMRANLDLLLDWAHAAGLGELALEHTHTLSSAINLLATPRKNLLQTSWVSLRSDYPALSPAQLNHLLSLYSPTSPCRHTWNPSVHDRVAAHETADILESFDTHHPLVLPDEGYQFRLGRQVTDASLREQLDKLKEFMAVVSFQAAVCDRQSPSTTSGALPQSPPWPPSPTSTRQPDDSASCGVLLLSRKLRDLERQPREAGDARRSALDPSCLLTPPNTPHLINPVDKWMKGDGETLPWSSSVDASDEGTAQKAVDHEDDINDEVFSLELERGEQGLGLALVDTRDTSTRVKGVFVRAVVPDSPAARCAKLVPGDRILAVNGVSLLGLDYQSGKELIQSSGDRLRLLVARSDWMADC
uniref:Si:ch211-176g6.2 n=1 Tax=Cyclopterus lumpus TaxID=8103 RepID=A0A8C2YWS6_CYCLU